MAGPPGGLLALVLLISALSVQSEDELPKWSQKSSRSNGGWIPIEAPCLTCRAAADASADMEVQASSDFVSAPVKPPPSIIFKDTDFLRPPPAPLRVQRQEASRPILDTYIENQRPPPPPIPQPTGLKQGRDHRFLYTNTLPTRQQFQGFPLENQQQQHLQHRRVVFPTHQGPAQAQDIVQNIQPSRQPNSFPNQQFHHPPQPIQQHSPQQQTPPQQHIQHQQPVRPQKQIRLPGVPHDQFPLLLSPSGLGAPHGFQNPQLQLLPIPHAPQPTAAQVNLQNIFQHQLQNQLHHQINQQLLGSPLASPFPPSAIAQQLDFNTRNNPVSPVNVQLVPQQQQIRQPTKSFPPPAQKLETTTSPKPSVAPVTPPQADAPRGTLQKEKQVTTFQANPEEEVEEEVQLLYVPVEALRQRDRVNKQVFQNQNLAAVRQKDKTVPERQVSHSFEIKHIQNPGVKQYSTQNLGNIQATNGAPVVNVGEVPRETESTQANQGQETIVREEKLLSFTPPRVQQFHEAGAFQQQTQNLYPTRQFATQNQEKFRFQPVEQLQQEEQQTPAIRQQPQVHNRPISQQFHRQQTVPLEDNSQRYYQDSRQVSGPTFPPQTTSLPTSTSPSPTYPTTQASSPSTLAPYQPPLSVYMEDVEGDSTRKLSVDDVLRSLSGAKSVPVLERAGPNPPKVFVGPSVLRPPKGYAKFDLPYLSMLDSNRVERKVDRLPFFVAPLSFQPPAGYAKIPFPAPHVGSVVVSSTPVASTTERATPIQQSPRPSALPELVNSLQPSSVSASAYTPSISSPIPTRGTVFPFSSTPQPQPHFEQVQQTFQQYTPQQPLYHQQEYQPLPPRVVNDNSVHSQAALNQHLVNQQHTQESIPQQQPLAQSQPHSFTYHSTPIPSDGPDFYSPPSTEPTTTTTTTTPLPQTRAPAHHSRGRTRQRPSYTQTTSSESESNFRNRGQYRGNAASDTTRVPTTRTRRPWDGRRRPSTTTPEPSVSSDTYPLNDANHNLSPAQPINNITPSTTRVSESSKDTYSEQNIREPSPTLIQQQYSNDEVYSQVVQPGVSSNDGHLRNQGAVVLSAFQQPQVLGDVITGQIQRPDDNTGFRTYYGGQREYTVSTFEPSPSVGVSPTLPPVQSPRPVTNQPSSVYKGTFEGELRTKEQPRQPIKSKDTERGTSFDGQRGNTYSNYQPQRGQKYFTQQNFRETEPPNVPVQQNYPEIVTPISKTPYVEEQFVAIRGQRVQSGDGDRFRTYQQGSGSLNEQNQGQHNIYATQFTPSIEISETPSTRQSTPLPDISGVNFNQQPQYYIISTPIPNPVHGTNRTYANEQRFESQQPLLYSQVNTVPVLEKENPVSVLVNEGLSSKEQSQQDNIANNYNIQDTSAGQFADESPAPLPKTTQATTTSQESTYNIQTQEEPKRTRHRQPVRTYSSSNTADSSDTVNEERPRYRGQTRGRQPGQRTRSRHYTTENPTADEDAPVSPQRTHQRFRGRQRTTAASSSSANSQSSESLRNPEIHLTTVTERTIPEVQSEQTGDTAEFGGIAQDVNQFEQPEEQFRKPERQRPLQFQVSQENTQEVDRPVHSRVRTRVRGGERRQRPQYGSFSNDETPSTGNTYSRNPVSGQRNQHIPRRNIGQELAYQEPQIDNADDTQHAPLGFDSSPQNTPLSLKGEGETSYSASPIVIESFEAKDQKDAIRIVQGPGVLSQEVPANQGVLNEQYEQPLLSIDAGSEYQEAPTTPLLPSTTEATTTTTVSGKPGRKYGNFVSRVGSPRRQSYSTASLNSVPSTTPPPDNTHSNKVYTVRPARRPAVKPTSTTRIRIRRPTTPTTTTTSTTTEPSYYLTTPPTIDTQQENPTYDTPSFGSNRGGFRARKRPVAALRRPASQASNEVNQEDQEEEPRIQGGFRQRARIPSRRLSPSSTERTATRWRQSEFPAQEELQEQNPVSQSAQGFKTDKSSSNSDSYAEQQGNDDSRFQVSEEQLASHIPTKALRTQDNVEAFNHGPVYQSGVQYYSQESQQTQDGQDVPLKYHNPPVRPTSFVTSDDAVYTYEGSRPFSAQPVAQSYENSPGVAQQKGAYRANQQDFVINFSGAGKGEDSLYPGKDELESGEESRYFDKVKVSKSSDKSHLEKEKGNSEVLLEVSVDGDTQPAGEQPDDSQGHSSTVEAKVVTPQPEESSDAERKEPVANDEQPEKTENRPLKKVPGSRRRGNWVRVRTKVHRTRPDTLETAESQNLASVSQNLLQFTTPLKEKATPGWQITPEPPRDYDSEGKRPDDLETEDDAGADGESLETTDPTVSVGGDFDLDVGEELSDHSDKGDRPREEVDDVFEDLENGDFSPADKESTETEYDEESKEKNPESAAVQREDEEEKEGGTPSENVDPEAEESPVKEASREDPEKSMGGEDEGSLEENAHEAGDKATDAEGSTEQPQENYDEQHESEKTDESMEERGESATDPSTPRVLGTSTTTEISLETEICYRGRCVKTKVDADQVPVE